MKHRRLVVSMIWLVPSLTACAPTDLKWTEEVKLHDGKIVQIKRHTELTTSGFPVQTRGFHKYHEFCYAPMDVHWKSKPGYQPEVFDIVSGKAYAKVTISDCERCTQYGFPETDALYFTWTGKAWQRIADNEFPAQSRLNLLMSAKGPNPKDDARGLVSLADKERRDSSIHYSLKLTGARGLNEMPPTRGACKACRAAGGTSEPAADVFLPIDRRACD